MNVTFATSKLRDHHDKLSNLLNLCLRGLARQDELQTAFYAIRGEVTPLLDPASLAGRIFSRGVESIGGYWVEHGGGSYAPNSHSIAIIRWISLIEGVLKELEPGLDPNDGKEQVVLAAGDVFGSVRQVYRLLQQAQTSITIVDPYLDESVLDHIGSLPPTLRISLLAGTTPKPIFLRLLRAIATTHPAVEARAAVTFHDRYIVLDNVNVWLLGCSINGLGKKTSTLSRISDPQELPRILRLINDAWTHAQPM